jgi:hypothetical protein
MRKLAPVEEPVGVWQLGEKALMKKWSCPMPVPRSIPNLMQRGLAPYASMAWMFLIRWPRHGLRVPFVASSARLAQLTSLDFALSVVQHFVQDVEELFPFLR